MRNTCQMLELVPQSATNLAVSLGTFLDADDQVVEGVGDIRPGTRVAAETLWVVALQLLACLIFLEPSQHTGLRDGDKQILASAALP